jgi:hypothetical protein
MAYEIIPEAGEQIEAQIQLKLSKKAQPFHFGVTNRALYIPRIKLIAMTDPFYFQRVRLEQIQEVRVKRIAPYALWVLAALMILLGLVTTIWMMEPVLRNEPGTHRVSGWPIAVFLCGFLVPFAAKGRFGLEVCFSDGKYRWKPPLVVDGKSKQEITETFQIIIDACEKVGTRVFDQRGT